ncbi:hypothetical protein M408DRAFT_221283 [Serendipita vermifera MAFF 305830]|uniref:NADH dehydrogenase [ubiquinone] 1 alpha subcomplex subunit 13 n=1 Tax=Serendipita vermifera MAFF 305830 TaxID=933852 RepID=A0A0C2X7G5_SERVB|nr:hypothetical protein M408DRAFT_221283 [Serendipita vermifera MAFF 305830]
MPLAYNQDLPPSGGFETLKYKRSLPFRGPSGLVLLLGTLGVCGYGFYRYGLGAVEQRELKREKAWSRIHLIPLLEAENDRDKYRRAIAEKTIEDAIMQRHKGWKAGQSVYFNDRGDEEKVV